MTKDTIAVINGHEYKYRYNPESKQMDYLGPVGEDAPPLSEEQFRVEIAQVQARLDDAWRWMATSRQSLNALLDLHWDNQAPADYIRRLAQSGNLGAPDSFGFNSVYWEEPKVNEVMIQPDKKFKVARRRNIEFEGTGQAPTGYEWVHIKDEEVFHQKPVSHKDYCYAGAKIEVPPHLVPVLHQMSGSIQYDPLKKEVTARCHALVKNAVTLKAVEDLVAGQIDPKKAGKEYGKRIKSNAPTGKFWYPRSDLKKKAL
jgi:hypothetical protein